MTTVSDSRSAPATVWTWLAALIALGALVGSLYLSLGMELKVCPLGLYQRAFIMGAAAVLWVGLPQRGIPGGVLSAVAAPLAVAGLVVAGYHVHLEATGLLECPHGIRGIGTAPQQSLAAHIVLLLLLVADMARNRLNFIAPLATTLLGILLASGAVLSLPKSLVPDYTLPVDKDMCRPPKTSE